MSSFSHDCLSRSAPQELFLHISQGLAGDTGEKFFHGLVEGLARALDVSYVFVGEYQATPPRVVTWPKVWAERGFFGSEFKDGYYALLILSVGQLVNVLSGSVGYIMTMTGRQKQAAYVLAISAALNIVMNYMLIPHFGIEGAAIATAVSLMLWNIALILYIRKKINLNSTMFPGRI